MRKVYRYLPLLISFGLLACFAHRLPYFPGDVKTSLYVQQITTPLFAPAMKAVSFISSLIPAIIIVVLLIACLWVLRKRLEAVFIGSATGIASLINFLLKLLIARPRPTSELVQVLVTRNESSFPSGHTTYAVAFYGLLFFLAPRLIKRPKAVNALRSILIILILLTMLSRIYLGVHWLSDILGSLLFGGLILAIAIGLYRHYAMRELQKTGGKSA